jgi:hypothetical protein
MRFELTEACTSPPFQDGALNRSANPPVLLYNTKRLLNCHPFLLNKTRDY